MEETGGPLEIRRRSVGVLEMKGLLSREPTGSVGAHGLTVFVSVTGVGRHCRGAD